MPPALADDASPLAPPSGFSPRQSTRELRATYLATCEALGCAPTRPLVEALDRALANDAELYFVKLNGNSKELFDDRLSAKQVEALALALRGNDTVAELDLSYNFIDDDGIAPLAETLRGHNTALLSLNVRGNELGARGAASVAAALSDPAGAPLTDLNLRGNPIGDAGADALAAMLRVNKTLLDLDMSDCDLGIAGVVAALAAVRDDNETLESLALENPRIRTFSEEHAWHAAKMLGNNRTLRALRCGKWRLGSDGLEQVVAYGLCANDALETLDLRGNAVDEIGGAHVARALRENRSLRVLNLEANKLGDVGARLIAEALPHAASLLELDVRSNGVREGGLAALAEGARAMPTRPKLVRLWGNDFGEPGSVACEKWCALLRECEARGAPMKADITFREVDGVICVARMTEIGTKEVGNTF